MIIYYNMKYILLYVFCLLGLTESVYGHASLIKPCPRFVDSCSSKSNFPSDVKESDYNINSPIGSVTNGTFLPFCKTSEEWKDVVDTLEAGSSYTVKFNPNSVSHSGGHCEFSVSYDGGKTFVVLHQELKFCFVGSQPPADTTTNEFSVSQYTFDIPSNLPSADRAIFAWTWVNASGNREFYMNCADVAITGSSSTSYIGKKMTIVNYEGYPTVDQFGNDYNTGLEYYNGSDQVTVISGGGNGSGGSSKSNSKESKSKEDESSSSSDAYDPEATFVAKKIELAKSNSESNSIENANNSFIDDEDLNKCDLDETDQVEENSSTDEYEYVCDTGEDTSEGNSETSENESDYEYVCDTDEDTNRDNNQTTDKGETSETPTPTDESSASPSPVESSSSVVASPVMSSDEPELVCDNSEDTSELDANDLVESLVDNMSQQDPSSDSSFAAIIMSSISISDSEASSELSAESSAPVFSTPESTTSESFILFEYSGQETWGMASSPTNSGDIYGPNYVENEHDLGNLDSVTYSGI